MGNLKKILSLHEASQISGYHQDYLSALIRKGEIKGQKMGRSWLTTQDEIENYIFKQKIRNKNWIIKHLLYFRKLNSSFIYAFLCVALFSVGLYFYNKNEIKTEPTSVQASNIGQSYKLAESEELKF